MKVIIVGGGASGVICALKIKELNPKIDVTILEQNDRILKKLLKTGNGKCNIMNNKIDSAYYNDFSLIEQNRDINVYHELQKQNIILKEMSLSRVYPYSEQAKTVVNVLVRNLEKAHVNIVTNELVNKIIFNENAFIISTNNITYKCDKVVVSTGSIAQERTNGYEIIKNFGLQISSLEPGLVAFETKEKTAHLSGLRIKCNAIIEGVNTPPLSGEILFRDYGLSGILALDISRYVKCGSVVSLDIMSEYSRDEIRSIINNSNDSISECLEGIFPKMLVKDIIDRASNNKEKVIELIKNYTYTITKKLDYNEAQITIGGVLTSELTENFESKKVKDLFVTGELINVDGASGGYNLYFAWLSGVVCANKICK